MFGRSVERIRTEGRVRFSAIFAVNTLKIRFQPSAKYPCLFDRPVKISAHFSLIIAIYTFFISVLLILSCHKIWPVLSYLSIKRLSDPNYIQRYVRNTFVGFRYTLKYTSVTISSTEVKERVEKSVS